MSERIPPGQVVRVVRQGDPAAMGAPAAPAVIVPVVIAAPAPSPAPAGESPYGVPASAVQYCCGRGCRHCRIYWNRMKP
jgi:hypothetical protein